MNIKNKKQAGFGLIDAMFAMVLIGTAAATYFQYAKEVQQNKVATQVSDQTI